MCTSARTQFSSELWEASSGLGRPYRPPWPQAAPGPGPRGHHSPTVRPHGRPRPAGEKRGGGAGGDAAAAKGLMAAAPPAGSPPLPPPPLPGRWRCWPPAAPGGSGLLPPSPRPPPPAGKPPSAYLHWVSAPHPPGQEQPSTTAKITENRSQHGAVTRSRGRGRAPGPAAAPPGRRRREAPAGGGAPRGEAVPLQPAWRAQRDLLFPPRPPPAPSPGEPRGTRAGRPREGAGGREAAGPAARPARERSQREQRVPREALSVTTGQKPERKSGPGGEKEEG